MKAFCKSVCDIYRPASYSTSNRRWPLPRCLLFAISGGLRDRPRPEGQGSHARAERSTSAAELQTAKPDISREANQFPSQPPEKTTPPRRLYPPAAIVAGFVITDSSSHLLSFAFVLCQLLVVSC